MHTSTTGPIVMLPLGCAELIKLQPNQSFVLWRLATEAVSEVGTKGRVESEQG
jgi:hypothetical protein